MKITTLKSIAVFLIGLLIGLLFTLGYIYFESKEQSENQRTVGKWTVNYPNFEGRWIHIRIDDRTIEDALETCNHEISHEMFALYCESNITKCMEVIK